MYRCHVYWVSLIPRFVGSPLVHLDVQIQSRLAATCLEQCMRSGESRAASSASFKPGGKTNAQPSTHNDDLEGRHPSRVERDEIKSRKTSTSTTFVRWYMSTPRRAPPGHPSHPPAGSRPVPSRLAWPRRSLPALERNIDIASLFPSELGRRQPAHKARHVPRAYILVCMLHVGGVVVATSWLMETKDRDAESWTTSTRTLSRWQMWRTGQCGTPPRCHTSTYRFSCYKSARMRVSYNFVLGLGILLALPIPHYALCQFHKSIVKACITNKLQFT